MAWASRCAHWVHCCQPARASIRRLPGSLGLAGQGRCLQTTLQRTKQAWQPIMVQRAFSSSIPEPQGLDQPGPPPVHPFFMEVLRGMGQVVFCNSALSGAAIAGGLLIGDAELGVTALAGVTAATLTARAASVDHQAISDGLMGYNGALVGCALAVFQPGIPLWTAIAGTIGCTPQLCTSLAMVGLTAAGAAATVPLAAKLGPLLAPVPQYTIAFNAIVLAVLAGFTLMLPPKTKTSPEPPARGSVVGFLFRSGAIPDMIEASLHGVSQIFVANHAGTGLMVLGGIFCYSPAAAAVTFAGSLLGSLTAILLRQDVDEVMDGLWGYNSALTALAVSIFFVPLGVPFAMLACGGAMASTLATIGFKEALGSQAAFCSEVVFRVWFMQPVGSLGTGASVRVEGEVVESPAKGQEVEISCSTAEHSIEILGTVDSKAYPLSKKKHSIEFLREIAHLRPRSNLIGAVSRVRNNLAMSTHRFFQDRGFLYVHTPIITTADCEGAGEMFRITAEKGEDVVDSKAEKEGAEFFGRAAYLTVSGQLAVENFCCGLGDVYTFGPTFRAENSSTTRHLAEFWMIEPEIAFANLEDDMDCAEAFIRFCVSNVLESCKSDVDFFNLRVDKEIQERLQLIASKPFARMSYTEAVEVLQKHIQAGDVKFEFEVEWGKELQTEHEKFLTDEVCKGPCIVYNYPKDCKAFYMRLNEDGKTVAAMDLLCPGIGELVGGSQREERIEVLDERIAEPRPKSIPNPSQVLSHPKYPATARWFLFSDMSEQLLDSLSVPRLGEPALRRTPRQESIFHACPASPLPFAAHGKLLSWAGRACFLAPGQRSVKVKSSFYCAACYFELLSRQDSASAH
ncbi:asnS [Symbiodinium natans]|uniref:asparagine--tRNA ligase n=1 Tax=Symbiodinium natans TaxID=878477 RepID=A0A812QP58_9DINO|nr:asnS [Symbiodinium natans]